MDKVQEVLLKEYLEHYYDKKIEELVEIKLGSMTMEYYEKRFWECLKYAYFIKEEKVKIQMFLSGLLDSYKDKIQYDIQNTLKDDIWKEKHLYD